MKKNFSITIIILFSFTICFAQPAKEIDYLSILKNAADYNLREKKTIPAFQQESANTPELVALRKKFNLDSVAGFGTSESRLINILHWVHNTVGHDGTTASGINIMNADVIIAAAKEKGTHVSCGELASVLNDCLLAMGWSTRKVFCFPKDSLKNDPDSHVINCVYLSTKEKWIWLDPTNDAYIMDENGELLGIEEVRERLINGKPMIVNPDANWNHRSSAVKQEYLYHYMAKNLYRLYSPLKSEYLTQPNGNGGKATYIHLLPLDYKGGEAIEARTSSINIVTNNPNVFWKAPGDE
jgi:hypothetical protein